MSAPSLASLFDRAKAELVCWRCRNGQGVMTPLGMDECPDCRGEHRNSNVIALLAALVERAEQ